MSTFQVISFLKVSCTIKHLFFQIFLLSFFSIIFLQFTFSALCWQYQPFKFSGDKNCKPLIFKFRNFIAIYPPKGIKDQMRFTVSSLVQNTVYGGGSHTTHGV